MIIKRAAILYSLPYHKLDVNCDNIIQSGTNFARFKSFWQEPAQPFFLTKMIPDSLQIDINPVEIRKCR